MTGATGIVPAMESEGEEWKESWQDNCLEALAALANTRGGTLWVGVKDNGDLVAPDGWSDAGDGKKKEVISNKIIDKLGVHPASMTIEIWKEKPVLAIQMHRAPTPVSLNGRYYRRVGNSTREVPAEELTRFLLERTGQTWDTLPASVGLEVIDEKAIEDFKVLSRLRLPALRPSDDAGTILSNMGLLIGNGQLSRAAVLLFGKREEVQRQFPNAFVQMGRFTGLSTILDEKPITGNLFEQLDGVTQQFRSYLETRYEFPELGIPAGRESEANMQGLTSLLRVEALEYPLVALREAVANALLHRDYTSTGRVMIRVYKDHVLITSPGLLPEGISVEDLYKTSHPSRLRNPLLAQAFYYAGLVERWGTGTLRMMEACVEQGLPRPEFTVISGEFCVTFRNDPYTKDRLKELGFSERQIRAVGFIRETDSISNRQFREIWKVSDEQARKDLKAMVVAGVLRTEGQGRSLRYVLNQN